MSELTKVEADRQLLADAQAKGTGATLGAYLRLSGPGWLQSAITLGGGSLSGALFLGVLGGTSMLWLQLMAIIMGVVMLSAISYVTLSTGERPFRQINQHINPVLGWGWLIATCTANMLWCMPQFSLCFASLQKNLVGDPIEDTLQWKLIVSGVILLAAGTAIVLQSMHGLASKIFDLFLKALIAMIVISFFGVVVILSAQGYLDWGQIFSGFIPDLSQWGSPTGDIAALVKSIGDPKIAEYWNEKLVASQRDVMIAAAATAVGINMTFLMPYSMLGRGWDKTFRGLARFDLSTGMAIPYVLVTSCVVIASAQAFHAKVDDSFLSADPNTMQQSGLFAETKSHFMGRLRLELGSEVWEQLSDDEKQQFALTIIAGREWETMLAEQRQKHAPNPELAAKPWDELSANEQQNVTSKLIEEGNISLNGSLTDAANEELLGLTRSKVFDDALAEVPEQNLLERIASLPDEEKRIASALVKRNAFQLSAALEPLMGDDGERRANLVFGLGVFGMGFSTIIILMLINGYAFCEMLGVKQGGYPHVAGCIIAGIFGASWPFIWDSPAQIYLAIIVSGFGMMLLPIAYLTFFLMMNSRAILGDQKPTGVSMIIWNVLMVISVIGACVAAGSAIYTRANHPQVGPFIIGIGSVFVVLTLIGFFLKPKPLPSTDKS